VLFVQAAILPKKSFVRPTVLLRCTVRVRGGFPAGHPHPRPTNYGPGFHTFSRPASSPRRIETSVTFLWYGVVAGGGLRSDELGVPASKSVCSILPTARRLRAGVLTLPPARACFDTITFRGRGSFVATSLPGPFSRSLTGASPLRNH
jgi:hypothetical protein